MKTVPMRARWWVVVAVLVCGIAASGSERDIVDGIGRRVRVPVVPHRVIALAPSLTEMVYSVGAGGDVVGVTDYTEYPAEAGTQPSVGGILNPSIEKIVALHPDLVLATRELNQQDTLDEIERLRIPVFVVDPQGLQGILDAVQHVGRALNRSAEANQLVERLRVRREAVAARVGHLQRPRALFLVWPDPVITIGRGAFITELIAAAGGQSMTDDLAQPWPQVSLEQVLQRNPDVILLPTGSHRSIAVAELQKRPGWDRLEAIRRNRIIYVDRRVEHSSPVAFDALEDLARQLHPEAFRDR